MKSASTFPLSLAAILLHVGTLQAQLASASASASAALQPRPQRPTGPVLVNGIAAKVNGRVITQSEVSFQLAPSYRQLASQFPRRGAEFERQLAAAREDTIQGLIDRQIILSEFKELEKKGAGIKDQTIDEEVKRQIRELFHGDEAKFQQELKRSHLTMDDYRKNTKEGMIVQAMRANQFSDTPPPLPSEIQKEYDEIKQSLRDVSKDRISFKIFFVLKEIQENPLATPATQAAIAEDLAAEIDRGADFAKLAKTYSSIAFATQGGVQENVPRLNLPTEFAAIIFDAKPGQLVGPLEDPKRFTLAIPTKIEYGPAPALDGKVREMVEARVHKKKTSAQYQRWIESRRKRAMIEIKK
ncbi:MAG: SurA N-terminal domain-containing protein [Verrucomicrobia bacterium]|nr:SurA N-terminal domain-containing protein [Verrucomicrobiota bacterium]